MRCDACKHWDIVDGKRECQGKTVGQCLRAMPWWDASEWDFENANELDRVLKPEYSDRRFFAELRSKRTNPQSGG